MRAGGNKLDEMKPISADSHITEPPNCYVDYIDPKYRKAAPHMEKSPAGGAVYVIDGFPGVIPMGTIAAAGLDPREMRLDATPFEEMHRGGWEATARLADQDRDGVAGEILYPSVGMALCNHLDTAYKSACFKAYNRWLAEFVSAAPDRLFGLGQTAVASVEEAIKDFQAIKEAGFKGVMMPGDPATDFDYDHPDFDPLWATAVELDLPLSFHILTSGRGKNSMGMAPAERGPKENRSHAIIRANQDIIGTFIWGRVFERHPRLEIVCVEADAGWAPHFIYKLNYHYNRRRFWSNYGEMNRLPGEYFCENVYLTFQDDPVALQLTNRMNPRRLMWANDFPHSDSTWPHSAALLAAEMGHLDAELRRRIIRDNVAELYHLNS